MQPTAEGGEAAGLSFTEFSYQLLQAYDFLVLHRDRHCTLQLGGSDQLGNIVAGIELILRLRSTSSSNGESGTRETEQQQPAYGLTLPLLTTASGQKFGKSAGNAVWLDADMTSDFDLYQHLLRSADADVATYLRSLTLLPLEKVEEVLQRHAAEPGKRTAQKTLADEMVGMLRGASALRRAQTMSALLFERHAAPLPASDVFEAFQHDARLVRLDAEALGAPLARLAADIGAAASRGTYSLFLIWARHR
jgi:tyrosyl-tRNA synthetase